MTSIKVMIVEDSADYRHTLKTIINEAEGMKCTQAYQDAEQALEGIGGSLPDVALIDIRLPGMSGIELIKRFHEDYPEVLTMAVTVVEEGDHIFQALRCGATGYMLKKAGLMEITKGIRDLFGGASPMSPQIARLVVRDFQKPIPEEVRQFFPQLTNREFEVLNQIRQGYSNKEIASTLFISTETVRDHCRNIYRKLHVRSKHEAIIEYYERLMKNRWS